MITVFRYIPFSHFQLCSFFFRCIRIPGKYYFFYSGSITSSCFDYKRRILVSNIRRSRIFFKSFDFCSRSTFVNYLKPDRMLIIPTGSFSPQVAAVTVRRNSGRIFEPIIQTISTLISRSYQVPHCTTGFPERRFCNSFVFNHFIVICIYNVEFHHFQAVIIISSTGNLSSRTKFVFFLLHFKIICCFQ